MSRLSLLLPFAFLFTPLAVQAGPLDAGVAVVVRDDHVLARTGELVKLSVPIAESEGILDPSALRVLAPNGAEVPVQWRVLTRWRGTPTDASRPVRFALAQFLVDLAPGEAKVYVVKRRAAGDPPAPQPKTAVALGTEAGNFVITTGPARFVIAGQAGTLFHSVLVDLDGDGVFEPGAGERLVAPYGSVGPVLVDRFNGVYAGAIDLPQVKVEEQGPLHLVLRIDGRHMPIGPNTIGRDFLTFTTRMHFVAGSTAVRVEHTLENSYVEKPLGSIGFARYLLHLRFDGQGAKKALFGPQLNADGSIHAPLKPGQEVFLYQDSAGGAYWPEPGTTFNGFRVFHTLASGLRPEGLPNPQTVKAIGARSEGWMNLGDDTKGILVALRYPWQNYPYAMRAVSEGSMIVDLWPAEFAGEHWLDDGQRKMHDLTFDFHRKEGYDPRVHAERYTNPLRPVMPAQYVRATRAWGDHGDLRLPQATPAQMKQEGAKVLQNFLVNNEKAGGYGWQDFGEPIWAKSTHTTGSPRNKLSYFDHFVTSGALEWFIKSEIFALHSMDVRTYHIDGFVPAEHPGCYLQEGLPHGNGYDQLGRDKIDPKLAPHKAGIPKYGHGWNGFDAEHMVVDDVFEYYLLTGSYHALDALDHMGKAMQTWHFMVPDKPIPSSRVIGWGIRAMVKTFQATGDPGLMQKAKGAIESVKKFRGQSPSPVNGKVYHWLSRVQAPNHGLDVPYEMPWQVGVALYGLTLYAVETGDASVKQVIRESSDYLIDYAKGPGWFCEALACDDHTKQNPKYDYQGVNSWMASALALAWKVSGRPETLQAAKEIFEGNKNGFFDAGDNYHWYHTIGDLLGK